MTTTATIPAECTTTAAKLAPPKKAPARSVADALAPTKPFVLPAIATGRQMVSVPLAQIIDSPDNPRDNVGDVTGLAASIAAVGLLEPVLLVPAEAYRAGNNQLPDTKDTGKFVLIAGHRRAAACRLLKLTHVDAIVEEGRVGVEARKAMIIENFQRVDLTPLEEAKAFAELQELGVKQDDMAVQVGCSQSHISKRLGLLKLDPKIQAAVDEKALPIADALELGKLTEHGRQVAALEQMTKYRWPAANAVRDQLDRKKADEATAKHRKMLKDKKIEEAKNLQSLFGYQAWQFELKGDELKRHQGKKPGEQMACLVGSISERSGEVQYFCKAKKKCSVYGKAGVSKKSPHEIAAAAEEKQRKLALKARREAAALLGIHGLPQEQLTAFLADQFVEGTDYNMPDARKLAHTWLLQMGFNGLAQNAYSLLESIRAHNDSKKIMARYVATLRVALLEVRASSMNRRWDAGTAQYLYELSIKIPTYSATEWEIAKLEKEAGLVDGREFLRTGALSCRPQPCVECDKEFDPQDLINGDCCGPCYTQIEAEEAAEASK